MIVQTVMAVYQNGILKPEEPLNLAENEQVEVQIMRVKGKLPEILKLSGIWRGLGDPTYRDIQTITYATHQQRQERLLTLFDEQDGYDQ